MNMGPRQFPTILAGRDSQVVALHDFMETESHLNIHWGSPGLECPLILHLSLNLGFTILAGLAGQQQALGAPCLYSPTPTVLG